MKCAVGKCKQSSSKKSTDGKCISFYNFPKDEAQRKLWVTFCKRANTVNAQSERMCALHFTEEDFERNFKFEMGGGYLRFGTSEYSTLTCSTLFSYYWIGLTNRRTLKLKPGAVPTVETTATANDDDVKDIEAIISKYTPIAIHSNNKDLERKIDELQQENYKLKKKQKQSAITIKNLSSKIQRLNFKNTKLEKALARFFTEGQIKKLKNGGKRQTFTEAEIAQSLTLYSTSAKAYKLLMRKQFPLPSVRTLQRWSQKLNVTKKNKIN